MGEVGSEKVLIRCTRNDYEPDMVFFSKEKVNSFTLDQMFFPPPDLAAEVLSESTRGRDYGIKFEDYASHSVQEYWIIDPDQKSIEQYLLQNESFILHQKLVEEGQLKSEIVVGFVIQIKELFF